MIGMACLSRILGKGLGQRGVGKWAEGRQPVAVAIAQTGVRHVSAAPRAAV
jgi:hypothetical protein